MPPHASWSYQNVPQAGTAEDALYRQFLVRREWV
jgi:coproporphyrinogen III oxidase